MDKTKLKNSGRKTFLFALQCFILIFCIWYIEFIYYINIYPDKFVRDRYEQTSCQIIYKTLAKRGKVFIRYRADFIVSYLAAGVQYRTEISGNGLDRSFTTDKASEENILNQFEENENYFCWYNPDMPNTVVLILRHNWSSTFPLFIPTVIALIVAYYLIQSIFGFLGVATIKTKEVIKEKRAKKNNVNKL